MSDITTIFGLLFILGVGLPGLMTTWWLLFPGLVGRARSRVERTPWKTFFMGLAGLFAVSLPIAVLFALPGGPAKLLGATGILLVLTFATAGSAGIASMMADRLSSISGGGMSPFAAFVRGAVALELAAAVPILGWFVIVPFALVESMGATMFALLRWVPRPAAQASAQASSQEAAPAPQSA